MLPRFHGGVPENPYFQSKHGNTFRIAFFLTILDEHSKLAPPFRTAKDCYDKRDARVADWGIENMIGCDANGFFSGHRLVPFASLFTPHRETGVPMHPDDELYFLSFTPLDYVSCNALCFDRSTTPHSVVTYDAEKSSPEQIRYWYGDAEIEEIRYDEFTEPVAASFSEFTNLLCDCPPNSGSST
ncbi:hypothetical protein C2E31_06380 [Rhodopirellula baltica]|nr:hypothetical protein C2E31_06380 [Rhodopirellula baltica]